MMGSIALLFEQSPHVQSPYCRFESIPTCAPLLHVIPLFLAYFLDDVIATEYSPLISFGMLLCANTLLPGVQETKVFNNHKTNQVFSLLLNVQCTLGRLLMKQRSFPGSTSVCFQVRTVYFYCLNLTGTFLELKPSSYYQTMHKQVI